MGKLLWSKHIVLGDITYELRLAPGVDDRYVVIISTQIGDDLTSEVEIPEYVWERFNYG